MILGSARRQNQKFEINVEAPLITRLQATLNDQLIIAITSNPWWNCRAIISEQTSAKHDESKNPYRALMHSAQYKAKKLFTNI